jgi:hypothetical protein
MQTDFQKGRIGIGITTHNRRDVFLAAYQNATRFMPEGGKLVVVDDASDVPVPEATFRFEKNVGIATGKNKCLELLDDCEHIFLFDDDCYPKAEGWWKPYIDAGEPHLMFLFKDFKRAKIGDSVEVYEDDRVKALSHPRGCMLYLHRPVLDVAGGMDTGYARWGFEHGDLSNRIYNLGLTSFPYMDVQGSEDLIYSGDYEQVVQTTVKFDERRKYITSMEGKYEASKKSKAFFPYKAGAERQNATPDAPRSDMAVVCQFFNAMPDPQRQRAWKADFGLVKQLANSVGKQKRTLHVLTNCLEQPDRTDTVVHRMGQGLNPYVQRWLASWQFLRAHPEIRKVCLVDATDVEMLRDPFPEMQDGVLYVGDEDEKLGNWWMLHNTKSMVLKMYFEQHNDKPLLNCGVVCGDRETVMWLCREIYTKMLNIWRAETVEMPAFNFIIRNLYRGELEHGRKVTSVFKAFEEKSPAWFKHK